MERQAASPATTPERGAQYDALTSLRFVAAMSVLLFHFVPFAVPGDNPFELGYTGVTFFFSLSGFILAHTYGRIDFSDRQAMRCYLTARFARIYPVFLVSLLVSLPLLQLTLAGTTDPLLLWLRGSSLVLAPLGLHAWVPGASGAWNFPSWSISTELFFYLVLPFMLAPILRRPLAWTLIALVGWLASATAYAMLQSALLGAPGSTQDRTMAEIVSQLVQYFPLGRLPEFMLGIAVYGFWMRHGDRITPATAFAVVVAGALAFGLLSRLLPSVAVHNGLSAIFWIPVLVWAVSLKGGLLHHPAMVFLGKISFSLYLLHVPVGSYVLMADTLLLGGLLARMPLLLLACMCGATLSAAAMLYTRIEEPYRRRLLAWLVPSPAADRPIAISAPAMAR